MIDLVTTEAVGVTSYVFLNGDIVGRVQDAQDTAQRIRTFPSPEAAPHGVATVYHCPSDGSVYIFTDDGRVVRPLLNAAFLQTELLVDEGVVRGASQTFTGTPRRQSVVGSRGVALRGLQ